MKRSLSVTKLVTPVIRQPRILTHAAMITAVGLVMIGSRTTASHTAAVNLMAQKSGFGAALDQTAAANVVADVAAKTNLVISDDATKQATTLNAQVALPTSDDETLAKRQVVATAGDVTRGITSYSVNNGDTLSGIAAKFNITTATLLWANNLDDGDSIKPGQSLTILPVSGLLYTVQSGDTADSLANKYSANAAQILSYNNAEVKGLQVGQKVIIPDGVKATAAPKASVQVASRQAASNLASYIRPYLGGGNSYAYGYCTYYAKSRRPDIGSFWGNAYSWGYSARADGFAVDRNPRPGDVAWTTAGYYGHVAIVEQVSGSGVLVSEMNYYGPGGGWNRVSSRWTSAGEWSGFIH
ncbi:MAG TPA: LysM peptidoglycan-binding domain-containing protein [Candidatus Nanoarchaeia archaeon]|nr:LysM peptidoglycan-binding domain-containing protein [Candidatus Nanoarchaeia archaeon]